MNALRGVRSRLARARRDADRLGHASTLAHSGMVDVEYYKAQAGLHFASALDVVRHYLRRGSADGLSLHPLFEAEWLEQARPAGSDDPAVRYLHDSVLFTKRSPHAMFDLATARRALGKAPKSGEGGVWLAWVRAARPETPVPVPAGCEPVTWGELRPFLLACAVEWRESRGRSQRPVSAEVPSRDVRTWTAGGPTPLVSVVVSGRSPTGLRRVVDAARNQGYPELEVLVVDDGTHPDTAAVVDGIAQFDPRVHLVTAASDGAAVGLNAALRAATGEFLAFADSGFEWQPDFLADLVGTMLANRWHFAYAPVDVPGSSAGRSLSSVTAADLLLQDLLPLTSVVISSDLVAEAGGFDESLSGLASLDFLIGLSALEAPRQVDTRSVVRSGEPKSAPAGEAQPPGWRACVQAKRLLDWSQASGRQRDASIVSVVVPVRKDLPAAVAWTRLADAEPSLEVVLAGVGSRGQFGVLRAIARGRRVVVVSSPADTWSLLCNLGSLASNGKRLVFVKPGTELEATAVVDVARALDDPAVAVAQPINARIDLIVSSAGAYFAPGCTVPSPMLAGHAMSDAVRLAPSPLPAAYSAVLAVRAADFISLAGFHPVFANSLAEVDLSLRAAELGLGRTQLVAAQVTARSQEKAGFPQDLAASAVALSERWSSPPSGSAACLEAAGFAIVGQRATALKGSQPSGRIVHTCYPEVAPTRSASGPTPVLRWAIDIAAPATWWGQRWGDRYFAYSLAAALRRLGQQVAVDHREARGRETRRFDDVVLTLRGLDPVFAVPGPLNLMWVISHPDDVGAEEAASYDLVFAASAQWARQRSAAWGIVVEPLLQCTDAGLFSPDRGVPDSGVPVLFVGNARQGGSRPVVEYAVAAGVPVQIYGSDWERTKAADLVVAKLAPNAELGELYASAGIVLNDHWGDMARNGFVANRLFDAVACGARVLSDHVDGISELFGDTVQFYETPADLARLVSAPLAEVWPPLADRLVMAEKVRREHSFDRRAQELLAAALVAREERAARGLSSKD